MAETATIKYRAFLSYSHRDKAWGKWLHAALEGYRIDKDLVGRMTRFGPVPKALRPIFRDREDFSAGHSLTQQTLAALEASQCLIVLCSPAAAQSPYVNEEVRHFKAMGRADKVISVIVAGEPGDPERECFPPAIRFAVASDGALTDVLEEPIAADARPEGDGKEIAKQKVVAGLLGVGLDEIIRREQRAGQRRNRFWASLAAVFLLLTVFATSSAVYAYKKLVESEERLDHAIELAYGFVAEATAMSDRAGVPIQINLGLLRRAEVALDHLTRQGADTQKLRHRRALMLLSFADSFRKLGRLDDWRTRAEAARELLTPIASSASSDVALQRDLASAHDALGDAWLAKGGREEAINSYRASLPLRERVAHSDPVNLELRRELWLTCDRLADLLWDSGQHQLSVDVTRAVLASLTASISAAKDSPQQNIAEQRVDAARNFERAANAAYQLSGPSDTIRLFLRHAFAILVDPGEQSRDEYHALVLESAGAMWLTPGNRQADGLDKALELYGLALATRLKFMDADRSNGRWQRDLARLHDKIGDVHMELQKADAGRDSYRSAFAIRDRFASADASNVLWQVELTHSHWRLANSGDDPAQRWALIFAILRKLADEGKLTAEEAKRLPLAEAELAVIREPASAAAYHMRGLSHQALGSCAAAIADFDKAIVLNRVFGAAYRNRASCFKAMADDDLGHHLRLDMKRAVGNYPEMAERAIADYTKAIEIDPTDTLAYQGRAAIDLDHYISEAIEAQYNANIADPENAGRRAARVAELKEKRIGLNKLRVADCTRAIEIDAENPDAHSCRAWHYFKANDLEGLSEAERSLQLELGLSDAERSLQLAPNNAAASNAKGHILEALGRGEEAIAVLRDALAKNPNAIEIKESLSRLGALP